MVCKIGLKEQSVKNKPSVDITSQWRPFKVRKNHPTIIKLFASPVSLTKLKHRKSRIYPRIFEKNRYRF
jgi:hypothetical protein